MFILSLLTVKIILEPFYSNYLYLEYRYAADGFNQLLLGSSVTGSLLPFLWVLLTKREEFFELRFLPGILTLLFSAIMFYLMPIFIFGILIFIGSLIYSDFPDLFSSWFQYHEFAFGGGTAGFVLGIINAYRDPIDRYLPTKTF